MFSQLGCTEEDTEVDPQLGYPLLYPKLCRHAHAAGLPMPFTEGPPQRLLPYSPQAEDFAHLKDWDNVFPVVAEKEKDSSNTRKHAEELWQQLDHLGNAGFDPAKFRVDPYGNVVYWNADPSSPLAWDTDHWFPRPRGGKTILPNLRIVQWQAYLRKRNRLEFLVPWWDLQHGCSVNQFLSAFAAKNADFRKRSFALFFAGGEDESVAIEHVGECRPWPQQFREKKALCGLAAAAIVCVAKDTVEAEGEGGGPSKDPTTSDVSRTSGAYPYGAIPAPGTPPKRQWSAEEEEAVKRGVSKFGPGSWKEIKDDDITLANRSAVQIKEKFRLMRVVSRNVARENNVASRGGLSGRQSAATTALQKELRVKIMREEERREREEELAQLEETVTKLKLENEKERTKAQELESLLKKHKHRVEKHRKWAESQSSYRLCLERVLRDTMHQTMSYKEQARLTREACNVLIARLDSQKATCEAMEHELLQRQSQRETLEAAAAGGNTSDRTTLMHKKLATQGRDIVDVSSCVSLRAIDEEDDEEEKIVMTANTLSESDTDDEGDHDEVYNLRREHQQAARKSLVRHAIKVAMQVEDSADSDWEVPSGVATPPCPIQASKYMKEPRKGGRQVENKALTHQQYDADSESPGNESDSDFADDEMSPAIRIARDDTKLLSELSQFHDGPASDLREFCTRNSKPGDSDLGMVDYGVEHGHAPVPELALDIPIPSAGDSLRSDHSKQEVQKDVIMVQTEGSKENAPTDSAALCKQEYIDELLQQIRFRIPTSEVTEETMASGHPYMSEGHLDELLEQVLTTHLDNVRTNDAKQNQTTDVDDEKLREIGKSNLDKWLQALLFKDVESACSSPGRDTPLQINSPVLSQISMAAMRESLELASHQEFLSRGGEDAEKPRSAWGVLLRKLSVKHHTERRLVEAKEDYDMADEAQNLPRLSNHEADVAEAMKSLLKTSPSKQPAEEKHNRTTLAEGRHCGGEAGCTLAGWPGGIQLGGIASSYWPSTNRSYTDTEPKPLGNESSAIWKTERRVEDGVRFDYPHSLEKRHFPLPLSDVDEISETESTDSLTRSATAPVAERIDPHRHKKRVSIKVAGFVGWKKSSKRAESKLQADDPPPALVTHHIVE